MSNNQTDTFSPITLGKNLPYRISLQQYEQEFTGGLPTLQAFESATTVDGRWLLLSGRTAGLHGFSTDPNNTSSFPPLVIVAMPGYLILTLIRAGRVLSIN